jgi:hypothetical protein
MIDPIKKKSPLDDNSFVNPIGLPLPPPILSPPDTQQPSTVRSVSSSSGASAPTLTPPSHAQFSHGVQMASFSITQNLLDAWLQSIEEEKLRIKEIANAPSLNYQLWLKTLPSARQAEIMSHKADAVQAAVFASGEYQAWLLSLSPAARAIELKYQAVEALRVGITGAMDNYIGQVRNGSYDAASILPIIASSFVIGSSAVAQAITVPGSTAVPAVGAAGLEKIWVQIPASLVEGSIAGAAGLISALFSIGLMYQSTATSVANAPANTGKKDVEFARTYSRNLMKLLNSEAFGNFVKTSVVGKMEGANLLTEERKEQLLAIVKIVMLAGAIALYYKVETGGISGQEFAAMLLPKEDKKRMVLPEGDIRIALVLMLQAQLELLSPEEGERLKAALIQYMDTSPDFDAMLKPGHLFAGLFNHLEDKRRPIAG